MSTTEAYVASEATLFRKRTVAMRNSEPMKVSSSSILDETIQPKKKARTSGVMKQSGNDASLSMTEEELKAWRKEERRVRNRESAAKSRKKIRETISKLETEVGDTKTKYEAALRYILNLENERMLGTRLEASTSAISLCPPTVLHQDLEELQKTSPRLICNTSYSQSCSRSVEAAISSKNTPGSNGNVSSYATLVISDDDNDSTNKTSTGNSSVSSTIKDDESNIEPDQPLFSETFPTVSMNIVNGKTQNFDLLQLDVDANKEDNVMADFLMNAFVTEPNTVNSHCESSAFAIAPAPVGSSAYAVAPAAVCSEFTDVGLTANTMIWPNL